MAVCGIVALFLSSGQAQFLRTSTLWKEVTSVCELNPTLMPGRGYLNIPVIGSLNATVNSSSHWGIGILWTLLKTV